MGRPRGQNSLEPWLGQDGIWRFRPRIDVLNGTKRSREKRTVMLGRDGEEAQFGERAIRITGIRNARQAAAAYLQTINDTPKVLQQQARLSSILDVFLREHVGTDERPAALKANTRRDYRSAIESRIRPEFGNVPLHKIGAKEIQVWVNGLVGEGLSRSSVGHRLAVMASILDRAQAWGYIDERQRNPCELVIIGECGGQRSLRALEPEECRRLLAAAETIEKKFTGGGADSDAHSAANGARDRPVTTGNSRGSGESGHGRIRAATITEPRGQLRHPGYIAEGVTLSAGAIPARQYQSRQSFADMIRLALFCGLRIGEILALTWKGHKPPELHIGGSRSQTGITATPKNRTARVVALGPVALDRPTGAREQDRIFDGWEYWVARRALGSAFRAIGVKFEGAGWHTLRSTYATMKRGTVGLRESMGHARESTTNIYIRPSFSDEDQAARQIALMIGNVEVKRKQ